MDGPTAADMAGDNPLGSLAEQPGARGARPPEPGSPLCPSCGRPLADGARPAAPEISRADVEAASEFEDLEAAGGKAESIFPLEPEQRLWLRQQLRTVLPPAKTRREVELALPDVRDVIWFVMRTGIHPSELCEPGRYHLHISGDNLELIRNKTYARVLIPLHVDIRPWAARFVASLPTVIGSTVQQYSKKTGDPLKPQHLGYISYGRMVSRYGALIGLPGMTLRTLRHTCIADLYDATRDPFYVSDLQGTSVRVIMDYARRYRLKQYPVVAAGIW